MKRRKFGDDYAPSPQVLDHVEAVVELLRAMTGDNRYKETLEMARAQGEEVRSMDTLIDKLEARGEAKKERQYIQSLIEDGMPLDRIARISKRTEDEVLRIAQSTDPQS